MAMTLITTNPDSTDVSSVSFTSSIDSTYKLYIFKFYDVNPATDSAEFTFNASTDSGSNYNVTKTTTSFKAKHTEADDETLLGYDASGDLAQSTAFQLLSWDVGNAADESTAGILHLFSPSNTTYVKHFYCRTSSYHAANQIFDNFTAGYFNTTSAIDAIQFKMSTGNFDGVIQMYGIS